ncbi:MAG: hypothetical protein O7G85_13510 [Planctomycetota bacterium]|nr:hypothetical protein [Planctomycetota bacterium]
MGIRSPGSLSNRKANSLALFIFLIGGVTLITLTIFGARFMSGTVFGSSRLKETISFLQPTSGLYQQAVVIVEMKSAFQEPENKGPMLLTLNLEPKGSLGIRPLEIEWDPSGEIGAHPEESLDSMISDWILQNVADQNQKKSLRAEASDLAVFLTYATANDAMIPNWIIENVDDQVEMETWETNFPRYSAIGVFMVVNDATNKTSTYGRFDYHDEFISVESVVIKIACYLCSMLAWILIAIMLKNTMKKYRSRRIMAARDMLMEESHDEE